jgi:hypothetical protein
VIEVESLWHSAVSTPNSLISRKRSIWAIRRLIKRKFSPVTPLILSDVQPARMRAL